MRILCLTLLQTILEYDNDYKKFYLLQYDYLVLLKMLFYLLPKYGLIQSEILK